VQLAAADIHRIDVPGSAGEERFGKASGGRSNVEADPFGNLDRKSLKCRGEFDPAARNVRMRRFGGDDGARRNCIGSLANKLAVRCHLTGGNRGLRSRAALEQTALDQEPIGAFAFDHGNPGRGKSPKRR
jgi:hypothetical protein